jgi:uncharacterized membrane protein
MDTSFFEAANPEFSMGWDIVLLVVPIALAAWLFTRDHRRGVLWWPGLIVFILFLPNAPYAFTDILHLVFKIRKEPYLPVWAIALIVIPEYILYVGVGLQSYTISLLLIKRYLRRHGLGHLWTPTEFGLHILCAQGVFLGRRLRLNSWDMLRNPGLVLDQSLDGFHVGDWFAFVAAMFFVMLISYRILAYLDICIIERRLYRAGRLPVGNDHWSDRHSSEHSHHHHHRHA